MAENDMFENNNLSFPLLGKYTINGNQEQIQAINKLIDRIKRILSANSLDGLVINFGYNRELWRRGEKVTASYNHDTKIMWLQLWSNEYDFYHELGHHLAYYVWHITGRSAENDADRFMRQHGRPRIILTGQNLADPLDLPATGAQYAAIAKMAIVLGIPQSQAEDRVKTIRDARNMMFDLRGLLNRRERK